MKCSAIIICICLCIALLNACHKHDNNHAQTTPWQWNIPSGWPSPAYDLQANPLTVQSFELGRKLFYDGRLSGDGNYPCSSCHQQQAGFGTFDHDLSHGYNHSHTIRNAPPLINVVWSSSYRWDGRMNSMEEQIASHISSIIDMGSNVDKAVQNISTDTSYQRMFAAAYGTPQVNSDRMLKALASFVNALVSTESKYDRVKKGIETFSSSEQTGYDIFKASCAGCHTEPLFTDGSFRNIGLPLNNSTNDKGRMDVTGLPGDSLKFRVPTLRNVLFTFPYMHDGRIQSALQVMDHYSGGVQQSNTLDPLLKNRIPLSAMEKLYLLEFLKTLSDPAFIENSKFREPE